MLTVDHRGPQYCDGTTRRGFLRAGALGFGGLTLADLLRQESQAGRSSRSKSVIYIVLSGGPSHIDSYDLKPEAPEEFRGPFKPIATRLPGTQICEWMPLQAGIMHQLALLRGICSVENDHFLSEVYSGLPRTAGKRPAFGSVVSRMAGGTSRIPPYVSLDRPTTDQFEFEKPYYAGAGHAPFRPFGSAVEDLRPVKSLSQLEDRKGLLRAFDTLRRDLDKEGTLEGMDRFQIQALDMMTSPAVRDAFDLSREPTQVIQRYGEGKYPHQTVKDILYGWNGKAFLLARRLVEAGVRVVTLRAAEWDHHSGPQSDIFAALRRLLPLLDQSLFALISDLQARGMERDVLVVVLGEFGRTPKISQPGPGREHWAEAGCAVLFGGGLKMGQVIGETDSRAERARSGRMTFQNIFSTIYHVLGIDPASQLRDFSGRPQNLLDDCEPIRELTE